MDKDDDFAQNNPIVQQDETSEANTDGFLSPEKRAARYLEYFKQESPTVRKQILQSIGAVDAFAEMDADTITELTLEGIAMERGLVYEKTKPPRPACPHCGSIKTGAIAGKENLYRCYDCGGTAAANFNSLISGTHLSLLTWQKIVYSIISGESVSKACFLCNVNPKTYLRARLRVFYALHVFLRERFPPKLYGNVQFDETFFHISFKGYNLRRTSLFPPTDERYPQKLKPRDSKGRGGPVKGANPNMNNLAVFVATDEFGHCVSFYCGIGNPKFETLKQYVPMQFLSTVPETDPFPFAAQHNIEPKSSPGDASYSICDAAYAITKFANEVIPMKNYSRVFRKDGVQLRPRKNERHINLQRVNRRHQELKQFIKKINGSSRYIKGHLLVYDFNYNTGGISNKAAVTEIMRILVEPNLIPDVSILEDMFAAIPNYLFEWKDQDNQLAKLPDKNLYAFALMDKIVHPEFYPEEDEQISETDIVELTGLSVEEIWSTYRDYSSVPNLRERILTRFRNESLDEQSRRNIKNIQSAINRIGAAELALYDRYAEERAKPAYARLSLKEVSTEINETYGTSYSEATARNRINDVIALCYRPPLPPLNTAKHVVNTYSVCDLGFLLLQECQQIIEEKQRCGEPQLSNREIIEILGGKHVDYKISTILVSLQLATQYLKYENADIPIIAKDNHKRLPNIEELTEIGLERIYDAYALFRSNTHYSKSKEDTFLQGMIDEYKLSMNPQTLKQRLFYLSEKGSKGPLPPYAPRVRIYDMCVPDSAIKTLDVYERIAAEYKESGLPKPSFNDVADELQKELGLAPSTLKKNLSLARAHRNLLHPEEHTNPEEPEKLYGTVRKKGARAYGLSVSDTAFKALEIYERIVKEYDEKGEKRPPYDVLIDIVSEEVQKKPSTVRKDIIVARAYKKREMEQGSEDMLMSYSAASKETLEQIYDEFIQFRLNNEQNPDKELSFFRDMLEKHRLDMPEYVLKQHMYLISDEGSKPKLPRYRARTKAFGTPVSPKAYKAWEVYERIVQECEEAGVPVPSVPKAAEVIAQELGISPITCVTYLRLVRQLKKETEEVEKNKLAEESAVK